MASSLSDDIENGNKKIGKGILDLNIKLLYWAGTFSSAEAKRNWLFYVRYFCVRILLFKALYTILVGVFVQVYLNWENKSRVLIPVIMYFLSIMLLTKLRVLFLRRDIENIADDLKNMNRFECWDEEQAGMRRKTKEVCDLVTKWYNGIGTGLNTLFQTVIIPGEWIRKHLPFMTWWPYKFDTPLKFGVFLFFYKISVFMQYAVINLHDSLLVVLLIHIRDEYKLLNLKLRSIRPNSFEAEEEDSTKDDTQVQNHHTIGDASASNRIKNVAKRWRLATLKSKRNPQKLSDRNTTGLRENKEEAEYQARIAEEKKMKMEEEMHRRLVDCIEHQHAITSVLRDVESLYNASLLVQVFSTLIIGLILVVVTTAQKLENEVVGCIILFPAAFIQFGAFCVFSQHVTDESFKTKDAIVACDWFDASEGFKRSMRIIMSNANQPVVITAAGFVPYSRELFFHVSQSAYSYYTTFFTLST